MRNIEKLRNYFLGKDPQLEITLSDNSLRLCGIPGREYVLRTELLKRLASLKKELTDKDKELLDLINNLERALNGVTSDVEALENWKDTTDFLEVKDLENALTDYYTKEQVNELISVIPTFDIRVVAELPAPILGEFGVLYLVPTDDPAQGNVYDEYILVEEFEQKWWEKIGSTAIDMSNYYTKSETDTLLGGKQGTLTAGANITINPLTGEIAATDTTYSDFVGTDGIQNGDAGLVPEPLLTDVGKFLCANGSWETINIPVSGPINVLTEDITLTSLSPLMVTGLYYTGPYVVDTTVNPQQFGQNVVLVPNNSLFYYESSYDTFDVIAYTQDPARSELRYWWEPDRTAQLWVEHHNQISETIQNYPTYDNVASAKAVYEYMQSNKGLTNESIEIDGYTNAYYFDLTSTFVGQPLPQTTVDFDAKYIAIPYSNLKSKTVRITGFSASAPYFVCDGNPTSSGTILEFKDTENHGYTDEIIELPIASPTSYVVFNFTNTNTTAPSVNYVIKVTEATDDASADDSSKALTVTGARNGFVKKTGDTMTGGLTTTDLTIGSRGGTPTIGARSVVVGVTAKAEGANSIAVGGTAEAFAANSAAFNSGTARAENSFAEGAGRTGILNSPTTGQYSHAEGSGIASGNYSHAEGKDTDAQGQGAHTEGEATHAYSQAQHAEGLGNYCSNSVIAQHMQGKYGIASDPENIGFAHIVGWGNDMNNMKNIHTINTVGEAWFKGDVYVHCSGNGGNKDNSSKKLATEAYVDNAINQSITAAIGGSY